MRKTAALILSCMLLLTACGQSGEAWQEQYDLGVRYLSEGNYEEAVVAFTAAIEIDPKRPEAYIGRGDAYALSGDTEDNLSAAQADYEAAIDTIESTVSSTYASAMLGKERIAFLEARMDADKLKAEMSVQREDIGYSSSSDTLQAQMAVIQDEIEIITERITLSQNAYTLMYLAAYDPGRIPTISDGMAQ